LRTLVDRHTGERVVKEVPVRIKPGFGQEKRARPCSACSTAVRPWS
jgi:hypothetical protein